MIQPVAQLRADVDPLAALDPVLLDALTKDAHEMVLIVDLDDRILFAGGAVREITGFEPYERVGQRSTDLIHPDDAAYALARTRAFLEDSTQPVRSGVLSVRTRHRDGSYRHVQIVGTRLMRHGAPALLVVHTREVAGEARALARSAAAQQQLDTALWGAEAMFWQYDVAADELLVISPGVLEARGIEVRAGGNHHERWLAFIHPDDRARMRELYERQNRGELARVESTYRVRTRVGDWSWLLERAQVVDHQPCGTPRLIAGVCLSIDDTRQLQRELAIANQRLRLALSAGRLGAWEWDVHRRIMRKSPQWYALLGRTVNEHEPWIEQSPISGHIHPDDLEAVRAAVTPVLNGEGNEFECEARRRHACGEWRWMRSRGTVVERDHAGRPLRIVGITQDVHERRTAEEQLRSSETRHRLAFGLECGFLAERIFSADGAQQSAWFSDGFEAVFGCTPTRFAELGGWPRFTHPEDRDSTRQHLQSLQPNRPQRFDARIVREDGRVRRLRGVDLLLVDELTGNRRLLSSVQDVTEIETTLAADGELQADLVANIPACVVLLDAALQIRYASRGLLGRSSAALRGTCLLDYFGADWREQIRAGFERSGREQRDVEIEGIVPVLAAAADRRYGLHIAPALGRDPENHWCVVIRDISHALRDQSHAFRSIGEDLQRIGHDLRESVGQQLAGVALLMQSLSAQLERERHALAADATRIASLLNHSIDDLRALAGSLSPVGLAPAGIAAALEGLAAHARACTGIEVRCSVEVEPEHKPTAIEADHLYGIAQEAVSNAIRHSRAKRLTILLVAGAGRLELAISDDGQGMGEVSNSAGLGRGLALMTHRARAIGATLLVARPDGGGTSIRCLRLTAAQRPAGPAAAPITPRSAGA